MAANDATPNKARWGLALRDLKPDERRERELEGGSGVLVTDIAPDSPAADAGVKPGDIVLEVNRKAVGSVAGLKAEVAKVPDGKPLLLLVRPAEGGDRFAALAAR
jgi:serine protease Do